jgi:hypothetical protein
MDGFEHAPWGPAHEHEHDAPGADGFELPSNWSVVYVPEHGEAKGVGGPPPWSNSSIGPNQPAGACGVHM